MIIKGAGGARPIAILLDLDGTLIASDHAHRWAFGQILAPHGVDLTQEMFDRVIVGNNNESIMGALVPGLSLQDRASLAIEKEKLVLGNLQLIELGAGARELVTSALQAGCILAVVTNAPRENATAILSHFKLMSAISTVVAMEDTDNPKPSATPYVEALRRLGVAAPQSAAFEDSIAGVTAAVRAGIRVYGVRGSRPDTTLMRAGAFGCVQTLGDARFES